MPQEIDAIEPDAIADIPGPDLNTKTPKRRAPAGSCDCHVHVFGKPSKVPLNPKRDYTPAEANVKQCLARNNVLGIDRIVVVQPSTYGLNNNYTCEQVQALGEKGRGVAVTDMSTSDDELEKLHDAGFRGSRYNLASSGGAPLSELSAVAERVAPLGWHLQFFLPSKSILELTDQIAELPINVVFDHMGGPDLSLGGPEQPGFQALLNLLKNGKTFVKLSGAYRLDYGPAPWPKADPFARALMETAPDHCLWGSDWPHPYLRIGANEENPAFSAMPNDGDLFDRLLDWTDNDEGLWKKILVETPAKLYDFHG